MSSSSFEGQIEARSAEVYADFLLARLGDDATLLDCGTGSGTIAVGIASFLARGRVIAVDREPHAPREAMAHSVGAGISNLEFLACDVRRLPFDDDAFDVVFSHSMLETLDDPLVALTEMQRVLRPGGTVAVASVEYSGVICSGPHEDLLALFYETRERIWELDRLADPRMGRNLRRLLHAAGFRSIQASARYINHGTEDAIRAFGLARANDCLAPWFSSATLHHALLTPDQLEEIRAAWLEWSSSPDAFAAFSWCRAVARNPPSGL